jgi:hypothetical protein
MAFRVRTKGAWLQIAICIGWILISSDNVQRHSRYFHSFDRRFYGVALVFWISALLIHLWVMFFSTVEVTSESLRLRLGFHPILIPYASIVAVTPVCDAKGNIRPNTIEIEVAKLGRDIYPHTYRELRIAKLDAFLAALQPHILTQP